ncbi:MAG TPA: hypothetical protein VKE41_20810 [Roseiflexaceae bacterium]|nr:hypothetical protein [Roseiflexaceae bacterium]
MELTQPVPNTERLPGRSDLGRGLGVALALVVALLISSGIVFYVALRSGSIPSFDTHLTLDGRHALVIQNDLPCVPEEPPQLNCGGGERRREFQVRYSAPEGDLVLIGFELPER